MFKTKYQRTISMLRWLRTRLWFDEDIPEYKAEELIPLEIKRKLLKVFEKDKIDITHDWPPEANQFWDMFQSVKEYLEEAARIEKKIDDNLERCSAENNELRKGLKELEIDLPNKFDRIKGVKI